ncbi:tetratricopeptide repeat protein [Cerasicoccus arenae]|uniref:Tetratricopeptide repeat protein n=1 Tax=Cerasicoccus arenae TaxID=424488 RepID=A0A8J3DKD6_9BACT|nr:tetratricopeptide repeat protein [Cerasicoccus arenae]MBK1858369.1 tetratricopeptide repeat protein [Cerasicoccus arenae]GHC09855.1 hypothetical protein GCM10007047_28980 [Cerasicoccus arenae]
MNKIPRLLITVLVLLFAPAISFAVPENPIESLIKAGKFAEVRPIIEKRLEQAPNDEYLIYNLALTYYAAGDYDEAVVLWEKVRLAKDPELVTKAMAQIGNASFRISAAISADNRKEDATIHLRRAQRSLEAAVERNDAYDMARKNYEFVSNQLVVHLIEQGNSKIKRSESKWVKGEHDLVLFRSALTDYEEALSIKPEDEDIQELVEKTRQRMTDYLTRNGEKNLTSAEKYIEKVPENSENPLTRDETNDLRRAKASAQEAIANFDDAAAISPDSEKAKQTAEDARKKASDIMQEIAERQRLQSDLHEQRVADARESREEIRAQLKKDDISKQEVNDLKKKGNSLSRKMRESQEAANKNLEQALQNFEAAIDLNPDNSEAAIAKQELEKKLAQRHEQLADAHLEVADTAQKKIEQWEKEMQNYQKKMTSEEASEKTKKEAEARFDKLEQASAQAAQSAADRLLSAKAELEKATRLDPSNESAAQKLEASDGKLADSLEHAADMQLAAAEQLKEKGKDDQSIARMEQALKNFDSAMALSDEAPQQQTLGQKMDAAQQELLSQRSERALELAATQQQQQQMQGNQPPQPNSEKNQETAMEYKEMVQFTEADGGEQFGNFDTKAMKRVVKDW